MMALATPGSHRSARSGKPRTNLWTLLMGLAFARVAVGRGRVRSGDRYPNSGHSRPEAERGKSPEPGAKKDELSLKGSDAERTAETERDRGRAAEKPSEVATSGFGETIAAVSNGFGFASRRRGGSAKHGHYSANAKRVRRDARQQYRLLPQLIAADNEDDVLDLISSL